MLAKGNCEIVLLPDKGIPLEVAKSYLKNGGKSVYLTVPLEDKDFGIKHLEKYINEIEDLCKKYNARYEIINTKDWYRQDILIGTFGDILLVLGYSEGSLLELFGALYLRKFEKKPERVIVLEEFTGGEKLPSFFDIIYAKIEYLSKYLSKNSF